jgi:hypothetical protein
MLLSVPASTCLIIETSFSSVLLPAQPLPYIGWGMADAAGDHPPNEQFLIGVDGGDWITGIGRAELDEVPLPIEPLDRQFAVKDGDHNVVVLGFQRAVYHQNIAVIQPCPFHRIPGQADIVGGGRVLNQQLM